jgi:phosphoribosylanthranilate isomerase
MSNLTKIKICGLFREADIKYVNEFLPEYIGFVFAESKRKVTPNQAFELRKKLNPEIITVGVFVNESVELQQELIHNGTIDIIQTSTHVGEYLIFDSPTPGSGQTFDWNTIPKTDKPFFLAGGLNADNVGSAIKKVKPYAVDVSSGVETDGVKNRDKIKRFIESVRGGN